MKDNDPVFIEFKRLTSDINNRKSMLHKFGEPDSVYENSELGRIQYTYSKLIFGVEVIAFETVSTSELEFAFMDKPEREQGR